MWNLKNIFYFFLLIYIPTIIFPKQKKFLTITKCDGLIQTRHIMSRYWEEAVIGLHISDQTFIRLNSPDSFLLLEFPDGSEMRLIGITSLFVDYVSTPKKQSYQSKFLLFAGRWFYSHIAEESSRIIVNTESTISVLENGSGGGFLNRGEQQFIVHMGKGLLSYRKPDIDALVLEDYQMVTFKIYDGLNVPVLLPNSILHEYFIFSDTRITVPIAPYNNIQSHIIEIEEFPDSTIDLNLENILD